MNANFVFFGTPQFSVIILEELKKAGFIPSLVVTQEDQPKGRHLVMTSPDVKIWADENKIEVLQLKSLKDPAFEEKLKEKQYLLFIVASYGKIIPQAILDIAKLGTLNVHPSLLPRLRGPSPIVGAILTEDKTGVTIMKLDAEMDHGPIVAQKTADVPQWPPYEHDLETLLAHEGGKLLAEIIPRYIDSSITPTEQDHNKATYTKKFAKADMEINLSDDAMSNLRKIRAFSPHAYTFFDTKDGKRMRVIVKQASIKDGKLVLERIVPEGRKEMSFDDLKHGFLS